MTKTQVPDIAVVIVNYNRAQLLAAAIESVLQQDLPPTEIIVVDNGSTDGSADMVQQQFGDRLRLLRLSENLGFAGGNNLGIRSAKHDWIALLNNDAIADPAWLREMWQRANSEPGIGLVACRILRAENRDLLDNLGVGLWWDGMSRGIHHLEKDVPAPSLPLLPSGCAMLMRQQAFAEAGGFDETFFSYAEDTDLFLKIRLAGWKCVLAEKAVVYHSSPGTLGLYSPQKFYLVERNRLAILLRYYPLLYILISPFFTLARYLGLLGSQARRWWSKEFRQTRKINLSPQDHLGPVFPLLFALLRAYLHGLRQLPQHLVARAEIKKNARVPPTLLSFWLRLYRLSWKDLITLEPP